MDSEKLPISENQQYDPNLEAQDEELVSGGSNRLMYILVGVVLALIVAYVALPKGNGSSGLASVTPSFMLDDAAVTATAPTAADSAAAGLKASPTTAETNAGDEPKAVAKATMPTKPAAATATGAAPAVAASAPASAAAAEAAPAEASAAAPEPAAPSAPASVTMSGKIEDENGRPLVGATVLLKGSSKGTSTDANGNYSLEVPGGTDNTLIYGYGGYDDEEVRSRGTQPVNVTLTPKAKARKRH